MKNSNCWLLTLFALFCFSISVKGQNIIFEKPLSNRIANYDISARLDTEKKTVTAKQTLTWINNAKEPISELYFHAYMNAFKNKQSTYMKESHVSFLGEKDTIDTEAAWGWINITSIKTDKNIDISGSLTYISPDDNNTNDQTVFTITLPEVLQPGDTMRLHMDFVTKLPKFDVRCRSGYSRNFFFVGQWFPKIGVYENAGERGRETGGWNCHQYHAHSEFFSEFGVYNVDINVPNNFIVASGGKLFDKKALNDSTTTWFYRAEDIVDFAWTTSDRYQVAKAKWGNTDIEVFLQPEHFHMADRYTESVIEALEFFAEKLDSFPYPHMAIIDLPFYGMGAAGMEYTTLFTGGSLNYISEITLMGPELVTVHEFGHAFFMGILATNEFEEAWMDEGMNTYFETRIMDKYYGNETSYVNFAGLKIGDTEQARWGYAALSNPRIAESFRNSWNYPYGNYSVYSYYKPGIMLATFANIWGEATMDKIMRTYYNRWKFRHPNTQNFLDIVNEVMLEEHGENAVILTKNFFDDFLFGNGVLDYSVTGIYNRESYLPAGMFEKDGQTAFVNDEKEKDAEKEYNSRVRIERLGEISLPVEVLITFESGKEVTEVWDGKGNATEFNFTGSEKVISAVVDPNQKLLMDINFMNNSFTVEQESPVFSKLFFGFLNVLQNFIQFFVWFI